MEWAWSPTKTIANTYFKLFSECSFKGVIIHLSDHFVTPVYMFIFEQDPPSMSKEAMEVLLGIVDYYASQFSTFIQMFSAKKPPHVFPKISLDILVMQEVVYHISVGLTARL